MECFDNILLHDIYFHETLLCLHHLYSMDLNRSYRDTFYCYIHRKRIRISERVTTENFLREETVYRVLDNVGTKERGR